MICDRSTSWSKTKSEGGFLQLGTLSPNPWDLPAFSARMAVRLWAAAPPRHSGRWVGARGASLRSPILRPGKVSINELGAEGRFNLKNSCRSAPVRY